MVLNSDDFLLAGHGRRKGLLAMQSGGESPPKNIEAEGDEWIVPVGIGPDFDQREGTAYRLVDNRSTELGGYDEPQLLENLIALSKNGGLEATGYDREDIDALFMLLNPEFVEVPARVDEAEALREKWGTELGQLWQIGEHRLVCGDCTDAEVVSRVMDGKKAQLCLTDPPYGVGWDYGGQLDDIENLQNIIAVALPLLREFSEIVLLTPGNKNHFLYPPPTWTLAYFMHGGSGSNPWGFSWWNPILAYGKDPYLSAGLGGRPDATNSKAADKTIAHSSPKPIEMWKWLLERGSINNGDIILDPFLGSGTTLVACERLGRNGRGIEIEPRYVAVTLERMSEMDLEPKLISGA